MKILLLTTLAFFGASFSYSQYCTNVGPTSNLDSNVESVQITGVVGSINYVGCPGVLGLQNLTGLSTTLNAGMSYTISVEFGTCGGIYAGAGSVWIDFDQSFSFDPSEIVGTWSGSPNGAVSVFNFTVPAGAQNGATRMRVTQQEQGVLPLNPCATFAWGSVMDFSIVIGNGIDCSGFVGDDTSDPIIVATLPYSGSGDNSFCYGNQNLVYNSPDIYYRLNPSPLIQSISVSLCGSSFDTFLSVVDAMGNVIEFNDDAEGCGTSSALSFDTEGLGVIYVIVEGWGSNMGEYQININASYLGTEENIQNELSIYPNPTAGEFNIKDFVGELSIADLSGKEILKIYAEQGKSIDVSSLVDGIYFLRGVNGKTEFLSKIVVKK